MCFNPSYLSGTRSYESGSCCAVSDVIGVFEMESEFSETGEILVYPCRCGGEYILEKRDSPQDRESSIVQCSTCSLNIQVNGVMQ